MFESVTVDDYAAPTQTNIYYSKRKGILDIIWLIPMFGLGIYYLNGWEYMILLLPLIYLYFDYRIFSNRKPQVILNNDGMGTVNAPFCKWENISNEKAFSEGYGKFDHCYLTYQHQNGSEKLQIDNLDIKPKELERLMSIYRKRSEKK